MWPIMAGKNSIVVSVEHWQGQYLSKGLSEDEDGISRLVTNNGDATVRVVYGCEQARQALVCK